MVKNRMKSRRKMSYYLTTYNLLIEVKWILREKFLHFYNLSLKIVLLKHGINRLLNFDFK